MDEYTKDRSLRVFTAFSGYDSQCMALDRLKDAHPDFGYELVGWSEIDKQAITAHNLLFSQYADRNFGDISKIDWNEVPDFDLFTYSFPCTDLSVAGRQMGFTEGSGTRSALLWECRKAIDIKRPKYLLLENVKALVHKNNLPLFNKWLAELECFGYRNWWQVMNARDYGIPQNRERVFAVSVRKDCIGNYPYGYKFPKPRPLEKHLCDILQNEDEIAANFYLREDEVICETNEDIKRYVQANEKSTD